MYTTKSVLSSMLFLTKGCKSHKVGSTATAFYHVGDVFFVEVWLCGEYADYKDIIFDKSVMLLRPLTCHIPVSPGLVARRAR